MIPLFLPKPNQSPQQREGTQLNRNAGNPTGAGG
jgi:hypothetical protein